MVKYRRKAVYKQMAFETAVRNPERYKGIFQCIVEFDGEILSDAVLLQIVSKLYLEGFVSSPGVIIDESSTISSIAKSVIDVNETRKADGGYPSGYQSRFWTYMRTPSELGFVYAQYNEILRFSNIAGMLVEDALDEQEAFSLQAMKYNRKSPYRNVENDFNFFKFIVDILQKRPRISYEQFIVATFSQDGNVDEYLDILDHNSFPDLVAVEKFLRSKYNAKNKTQTILSDYPDVILRLLLITGFVTVVYSGKVFITLNYSYMDYINDLLTVTISTTAAEKTNPLQYFIKLEQFNIELLRVLEKYRSSLPEKDGYDYTLKMLSILDANGIDSDILKKSIKLVGTKFNIIPSFKYIADPLKLEFFISLLLAMKYGSHFAIKPNYKSDYLGMPISHAPGNIGDIEVLTDKIYWLIEVTLIRNKTQQLNSETTSVIRHLLNIDFDLFEEKYLSFVAPYVHPDVREYYEYAVVKHSVTGKNLSIKPYSIDEFYNTTIAAENFSDMNKYTIEAKADLISKLTS